MGTLRNLVCGLLLLANSAIGAIGNSLEGKIDSLGQSNSTKAETTYFTARGQIKIPFGFFELPLNFDKTIKGYVVSNSEEPIELFLPIPNFRAIKLDSTEYHMKIEGDSVCSSEKTFKRTSCILRSVCFSYKDRHKDALYLLARSILIEDVTDSDKIREEYPLVFSLGDSLHMGAGFHFGRIRDRADSSYLYRDVYSQKVSGFVKDSRVTLLYSKKNRKLSFQGAEATIRRYLFNRPIDFPARVYFRALKRLN